MLPGQSRNEARGMPRGGGGGATEILGERADEARSGGQATQELFVDCVIIVGMFRALFGFLLLSKFGS